MAGSSPAMTALKITKAGITIRHGKRPASVCSLQS
jgi:hypothetical protein